MSAEMAPWDDAPVLADPGCPYCGGYGPYPPAADWTPPRARRRHWRLLRRMRRLAAIIIALGVLVAVIFTSLLLITPSVSNAPALARALARAHRAPYPGLPAPRRFITALIATEDHRFYSEPGIDPSAIVRVILGKITGEPGEAGATLYQQLARMLYTPKPFPVTAEAEQITLGLKLAFTWPKATILQMYSDVTYFGQKHYGLAQASCGYFGVSPARLTWSQAALLAGIVSNSSATNPIAHFAVARAREAHVLDRLLATGKLTPAQAERAYIQPLHLHHGRPARCNLG